MRIKIGRKKAEIDYFTKEIICNICGTVVANLDDRGALTEVKGFGKLKLYGFGMKSEITKTYKLHICDSCVKSAILPFYKKDRVIYKNCANSECLSTEIKCERKIGVKKDEKNKNIIREEKGIMFILEWICNKCGYRWY